eukprot:1126455-Karenia_brevis.AAC.1
MSDRPNWDEEFLRAFSMRRNKIRRELSLSIQTSSKDYSASGKCLWELSFTPTCFNQTGSGR